MNKKETRIEKDSMGEFEVPIDAMYGASTARAIENFPISELKFSRSFIRALGEIKKACAVVNQNNKLLDKKIATAIIDGAEEVISGNHDKDFAVDIFQTGSGTSTNMNANEIIAKIASDKTGESIHPNDHVNMSQSSNDTFPTAMHIAIVLVIKNLFLPSLSKLHKVLKSKIKQFDGIVKIGRTHMMDATPITLSQEFSGYAHQVEMSIKNINNSLPRLYRIAQGATAVGTGLNTNKSWNKSVAKNIAKLTKIPFVSAPNKFEAIATHDSIVELSGSVKGCAVSLFKIANDIRLLSSGPRTGIGELNLPENEPGSSIMPGKVNPTQIEALTQVCVQVFGNDAAITIAGSQGNFELNTYKPMIAYNILQALQLLSDTCISFTNNCLIGIKPNKQRIKELLNDSLMLVTALSPIIGYDKASIIAKNAHKNRTTIKEEAIKSGFIDEEEFEKIVDPKKMLSPGK